MSVFAIIVGLLLSPSAACPVSLKHRPYFLEFSVSMLSGLAVTPRRSLIQEDVPEFLQLLPPHLALSVLLRPPNIVTASASRYGVFV